MSLHTTDALGKTTRLTYDCVGNLLSITDPDQNKTTYTYDALNRQLTDTNALGQSRTYAYNAVGNQTSSTDRNGRKTVYSYDALNRQTQENWLDATNTPIHTTTRSYDAASQLTTLTDPDSRYGYSYDLAGRLTSVDNTGTSGVPTVILGYSYNAVNNKLTTTDTINGQLKGTESYTYDALDRTTRITQSGNGVSEKRVDMAYDAASQRTSIARYADLLGTQSVATSDYSYDLAGRLTRLTHKRNSTTYADYQWTFDAADRITQFTSPDGTSNYSYDSRDQLTSTDHSYQSDEAYSYDANGNRTNVGYQTGANNRLLSDGTYSYAYDNEGNRIGRTNIATGEVTQYSWDYHNRLTSVITKDSSGTVTKSVGYTYDAYDRRITKVIDSDGAGSASAQTERMVYDGSNIALTFDETGTQTHRYLFGPGVDQILADEAATGVNWALSDNQGTVRDIINSNGVVLNHLVYDSYGQVTSETNPSLDFRYGYTGRERDKETGLNYNRARYYDTETGGFIGQDPIGFRAGDVNLYRYVGNNPVNGTDPLGLISVFDEGNEIQHSEMRMGGGGAGYNGGNFSSGSGGLRGVGPGGSFNRGGGSGSGNQLRPGADGLGGGSGRGIGIGRGGSAGASPGNAMSPGKFCPVSGSPLDPNNSGIAPSTPDFQSQLKDLFRDGSVPKASDLKSLAENHGFQPKQNPNGPLKFYDENGINRMTIKKGSPRTPGSEDPHIELKDASGQRIDGSGNPVTRRSSDNHVPINYDFEY